MMHVNGVRIENTFAEAFPMRATRLIITADTPRWAREAALSTIGFATSVIACGCEAGIETTIPPRHTPDGRPGMAILIFAMSSKELARQVLTRTGQCIMTAPTTACFAGCHSDTPIKLGASLRYFGDGHQIAKCVDGVRYWRIPVMDGEFLCADVAHQTNGVGGGNFLILAQSRPAARRAAEAAVTAMRKIPETILPFPGGVVRSGSKVGSKYKNLPASTNDAFCPTLKGLVTSNLPAATGSVMEIVIDGLNEAAVRHSMRVGLKTVCALGRKAGIIAISAGNYGGKLGPFHFHLHKIMRS